MLYDLLMIFTILGGALAFVWVIGMIAWTFWQIHLGRKPDEDHE